MQVQDKTNDQLIKEDSKMRRRTADTTTVGTILSGYGTMSLKPATKDVLGGVMLVCGTITALIGGLVLVGWVWGWGVLTSVRADYIPMALNSALLFILSGIALVVGGVWPASRIIRSSVNGAGLLTLIVAGMNLIGSAFGFDLEISHWLLPPTGTLGAVPIGHISPISSFAFIFSGAALFLLGRQARETAGIMGAVVMLVGWVNATGYWYGAPLLYGGTVIPVALPTSLLLVLLGAGLIAAAGSQAWPLSILSGPSTRALLLRGLLPAIVVIALIHGWLNAMALEKSNTSTVLESAAIGIVTVLAVFLVVSMQSRVIGDRIDLTEQELRESEKKYRMLADNMEDVIWQVTPDLVLTHMSPSDKKLRGYEAYEVLGRPIWEFMTPASQEYVRKRYTERIRDLVGNKKINATSFQVEQIRKDGTTVWTELLSTPLFDSEGNLIAFQGVTRDITERKRLEEERLEMQHKLLLAQKLESLAVMAGGIAHDFNNQLAAVLGNLELALMDRTLDPKAKQKVENAITAAKRSAELSRQMLIYSGNALYLPKDLDLNELAHKNEDLFKSDIPKTTTLHFEIDKGLHFIRGDADQIHRVIRNLVINASEATGDQGGDVTLRTGAMDCDAAYLSRSLLEEKPAPGRFVFLEVTDTGYGMDAETLLKLLDPFFSTKFWGRGLGMAEVMGTVKGHHGALIVDSEVGKGTTIRVLFPASVQDRAPSLQDMDVVAVKDSRSDSVTRRKTILVVDDDELVRDYGVEWLELLGYDTIAAVDGAEGVGIFRERLNEIDLVILDFIMPKMDGVEAFGELIRIKPDVKVIFSSGYAEDVVRQKFSGPLPASILHKPYDMDILRAELERLLGTAG